MRAGRGSVAVRYGGREGIALAGVRLPNQAVPPTWLGEKSTRPRIRTDINL